MVTARAKRGGVGAIGRAKMNFVHPSEPLRTRFGVGRDRDYLDGFCILRKDRGRVSRTGRVTNRYHLTHPDFPEVEFIVASKNFSVVTEGETPFDDELPVPVAEVVNEPVVADAPAVTPELRHPAGRFLSREEVDELREQGFTVDDDNEPVEENAGPVGPLPTGTWMRPEFCPRRSNGHVRQKGKWVGVPWPNVAEMDELELFLLCFPVKYLKDVVIPQTNKHLTKYLSMQELFQFIGCILFMACHPGVEERDAWWSSKPISASEGAPFRLNDFMSRNRFKEIMQALRYTDRPQPEYLDRFHDIRQMQDEWNAHMETAYFTGWFNCLDESMQMHLNPYVPGWMCVPRKPTPFGNEYHTICDGDLEGTTGTPIMWHVEIQEGKDRPVQLGPKKFNNAGGKTVGLMLRMHEPIARSGKACTMDSGFCVSKGIVEMQEKLGVYGQALIKKRGANWPKGVPGDEIDRHFADKPLGYCETLRVEIDGKQMFIHCMKEEKYVTKFMSTFGTLDENPNHKTKRTTAAGTVEFCYPEPVSLHNRAKHWVDDHNQRRHAPIDIADIWKTQWWPHRQFAFFLGISEANAANSRGRAKGVAAEPQLKFRKALSLLMLENTLDDDGKIVRTVDRCLRVRGGGVAEHELKTRPINTGRWLGHYWKKTEQKYQKLKCFNGCDPQARVRTYCACNKGLPMCSPCHVVHCTSVIG
jgi:hypothetical protein